jgi:hypothetical protein
MIRTILAALLLAVPAHAKKKAEKPMEWKGQQGPIEAGAQTIGDQKAWEMLWLKIGQDPPELDFKKWVAVAVFAGEKPTGGWRIEFDEPAPARGGGVKIRWKVLEPDGMASQAFAQPWKVRAFPKPRGQVALEAPRR